MKSFETSGMFVQEMILVAFFLLILVEIRLLCVQHSRKRKVEVMAVNFLLLSVTYGILTDLLSDYLAIWEGKNKLLHIAARWPAGILFFLIFADTGYLICRIRREDEKYKKELSVYSTTVRLKNSKTSIETVFYEWLLEDLSGEEKEHFCKTLDMLYWKSKRERQAGFENITRILAKEENDGDGKQGTAKEERG